MIRAKNLLVHPSESMSLTSHNGRILLVKSPTGRSVIAILRIAGKGSESRSRAYNMKLQEARQTWSLVQRGETDHLRRSRTTSIIVGRRAGFWSKQRSVMAHTKSVSPSCCASSRAGSLLSMTLGTMTGVANPPGVSRPAKTLGRV